MIGFDGIGVGYLAHPTLTTVRQPVEQISQAILRLVESGLSVGGDDKRRTVRAKPELVLGDSSPARSL